ARVNDVSAGDCIARVACRDGGVLGQVAAGQRPDLRAGVRRPEAEVVAKRAARQVLEGAEEGQRVADRVDGLRLRRQVHVEPGDGGGGEREVDRVGPVAGEQKLAVAAGRGGTLDATGRRAAGQQ